MRPAISALCAALALCLVASATAAERPPRDQLGRQAKLRILVDKVMQPTADWTTEEWMVKAAAEAGFNVWSPRRGHERLDEVRQVTDWCRKYGLYHMPWMRGSLKAPTGQEADGQRMVWANGDESPVWSPNADAFWDWTRRYIVEYARISAKDKTLMGVFLDYENYWPGGQGNLYSLSYDDLILEKFAKATKIELPKLALDERAPWLKKQGVHDAFESFQVAHWRERCRALRTAVDAHDPTFQFCVYPAPGTPFMVRAIYPEWATEDAPLILADACTYGRPSRFLPEPASLKKNQQRLRQRRKTAEEAGIPYLYAGGIDPVVRGADPEFCGKNAVAISEATDGYWIFYEGPEYDKDHPAYWRWFTWANRAIAAGNFAAQNEPRQTPEPWVISLTESLGKATRLVPPPITGESVRFPTVKLRRENLLFVAGKKGQKVAVELRHHPVSRYESPLHWSLRGPKGKRIASGTIPDDTSDEVAFVPPADGVYLLALTAGSCAYSVVRSNAPVGLYAREELGIIRGAKRLYVHVPEGLTRFKVTVEGWGRETVRLNVLDPQGKLAATAQTTEARVKVTLDVPAAGNAGQTWALELTRADEGVLEDAKLSLGKELPPAVSLHRDHVFRMARPD
jgi:hypothetical protein